MNGDFFDIDAFPVGCIATDSAGRITFANRYVSDELGLDPDRLSGKAIDMIFTNASQLLLESYVYPQVGEKGRSDEVLLSVLTPESKRVPVVINVAQHQAKDGVLCWSILKAEKRHQLHDALVRARDIFEDRANQLRKLAATDELTGLYNRREFLSRAGLAFRNSMVTGQAVSVLMADIDHFKRINDTLGHSAGDEVLRQLGERFRSACRTDEIVARYGGEEFVFCVEGLSPTATVKFAARMHEAAAGVHTRQGPLTISIGIGIRFGGTQKTLIETLRDADTALYAAKTAGRDRTCLADGDTITEVV